MKEGGTVPESPDIDVKRHASRPKSVQNDEGRVETHSLKDVIEADRYERAKAAGRGRRVGIRLTRLRGGGIA